MKDDTIKILLILAAVALSLYAISKITANSEKKRGYEGNGGGSFWTSLWNNAANIVDAGGRHTAGTVTATGNAISSIIATSKYGKASYAQYGYADEKQNYGPYVLGGAILLAAGVTAAVLISKN